MKHLISSMDDLRLFIPNGIEAVKGERSLYDKMLPALEAEQRWLEEQFLAPAVIPEVIRLTAQNDLRRTASGLVATLAFARMVPQLDLVLTPNGFGIVNNTNVVPASRDRVESLRQNLFAQADKMIMRLVAILRRAPKWRASERGQAFAATLFNSPEELTYVADPADATKPGALLPYYWNLWRDMLGDIEALEYSLALRYFSEEEMRQLRALQFAGDLSKAQRHAVTMIKKGILKALKSGTVDEQAMADIVEFIRARPAEFPAWAESDTARMYNHPDVYENKKDSGGYFF